MVAESISVETIVRRRKRRWLRFWLIWPVLALLGAGGGYSYYQGQTTAAAPQYATTAAATGAITVKISAVGTVQPIDQVNVSATISGIVSTVNARINDTVKKGDLLASLDTSALEAELARDKASLSSQEAKLADAAATDDDTTIALNRAQTLTGKGLAAQDTLTTAQTAKRRADAGLASASADIEVAKADVQLSQSNLEKARIYAPMDGMVLDRNVEVGQTVSASAVTLFQLEHDLGLMQLQVDVDEAEETKEHEEQEIEERVSLNEQRLVAVAAEIEACGARTVIDLGCGEGRVLTRLLRAKSLTKVVGIDAIPDGVAAVVSGKMQASADYSGHDQGYLATSAAIRHLRGAKLPKDIALPVVIVEQANAKPWTVPVEEKPVPDWNKVLQSQAPRS